MSYPACQRSFVLTDCPVCFSANYNDLVLNVLTCLCGVCIDYVDNCKPVVCNSDVTSKVEMTFSSSAVPAAGVESVSCQPCVNDDTRHCGWQGFTADESLSEANVHVGDDAAERTQVADKNNSSANKTLCKANKLMQMPVDGETDLELKQLSSCRSCNRPSTTCGHLVESEDVEAKLLNCSQYPRSPVPETSHQSEPLETVTKTEEGRQDVCLTTDADQFESEQPNQDKRTCMTAGGNDFGDVKSSRKCQRRAVSCATPAALRRHERVHVEVVARSTSCGTCGKTFRHASYLRCHERLHDDNKRPFVCDVCGKGFISSSNLTAHRRTHSGERPFACSICQKRFFQLCAVREHEKIHVGVKMFVCDVCGKQFLTHAQLYNHSRTHGGKKSFECAVCNKQFYTNGDLMKHARIHADRRPFVCDVCGKGFKYSSNLHGHARIHTGSRPFACLTCGKAFTYSSHLTRHAKMHTRNDVVLDDVPSTTTKDQQLSAPVITPATDPVVGITAATPSAILFVRPELLHGGTQVAANILPGIPIGTFAARFCD